MGLLLLYMRDLMISNSLLSWAIYMLFIHKIHAYKDTEKLLDPGSKCLIEIEVAKFLIPGIILHRHKNYLSLENFGQPGFVISVDRTNLLTASEKKYLFSLNDTSSSGAASVSWY